MQSLIISRRCALAMLAGLGIALTLPLSSVFAHEGVVQSNRTIVAMPEGLEGYVFTANEHGSSISRVDLKSGEILTVPVASAPHNVDLTPVGLRLLVVGEPSGGEHGHGHAHGKGTAGILLVFDPLRMDEGPVAEIEVGDHPAHVVADINARLAYVTNAGDDSVSIVDIIDGRVVGTVGTGRYPHGLRLSPDGRELYVANVVDGSVSVIDVAQRTETARIPVGKAPVQVGFLPDGSRVYVSLRDEDAVAIIDTATREVVSRVEVGHGPIQVHATSDGALVYVANEGSADTPSDTVSVIDVVGNSAVGSVRTGYGAHGVAVSEDGRWAFVTNITDGTVSIIDRDEGLSIATIPVGEGPNGIVFRPIR